MLTSYHCATLTSCMEQHAGDMQAVVLRRESDIFAYMFIEIQCFSICFNVTKLDISTYHQRPFRKVTRVVRCPCWSLKAASDALIYLSSSNTELSRISFAPIKVITILGPTNSANQVIHIQFVLASASPFRSSVTKCMKRVEEKDN